MQRKDTSVPELLANKYRLRSCEIIQKERYLGATKDEVGDCIIIRRKGNRELKIHIQTEDLRSIKGYYEDKEHTIHKNTLYNRMLPTAIVFSGSQLKSVTHMPRKRAYEKCGNIIEDYVVTAQELGHSLKTGFERYHTQKILEAQKKRLAQL